MFQKEIMEKVIENTKNVSEKEVPICAAVVWQDQILSMACNDKETSNNPCGHAEIYALQEAAKKMQNWRLEKCDLYVNLEPCMMCAGAIIHSRIANLYFAAYDPKGGAICSCFSAFEIKGINHRPKWEGGIMEEQAADNLRNFFKKLRS